MTQAQFLKRLAKVATGKEFFLSNGMIRALPNDDGKNRYWSMCPIEAVGGGSGVWKMGGKLRLSRKLIASIIVASDSSNPKEAGLRRKILYAVGL